MSNYFRAVQRPITKPRGGRIHLPGARENLGTQGLALTGFEVAEFNVPAEFKDAMASATLATARGKGDVIEAQTAMQRRVLEAQ